MLGEKIYWKEMKKGGGIHFFPPIGKYFAYFFPHFLKTYKIEEKKGWKFYVCGAHPLITLNFTEEKIWIKKGGGQKYDFQI